MVRCILVDTTVPVRIRPRMETRPVKGHFLSAKVVVVSSRSNPCDHCHSFRSSSSHPPGVGCPPTSPTNSSSPRSSSTVRGLSYVFHVPMYWPSMAVLGVRKPRPTSLYHRRCRISSAFDVLSHCHVQHGYSWATHTTLAGALGLALGDKRDVRLLLESALRLDGQLGSHVCG